MATNVNTKTELIGNKIKITLMVGSKSQVLYIPMPTVLNSVENHTLYIEGKIKKDYVLGESFDFGTSKFSIRNSDQEVLTFEDPSKTIKVDVDMSTPGENILATFTYIATAQRTITIRNPDKEIERIVIQSPPLKTDYLLGESLDLSGISIIVRYVDSEDVDFLDYTDLEGTEGFDSSKIESNQVVTIVYKVGTKRYTDTFKVNIIEEPLPTSDDVVRIKAEVDDSTYYVHEKFLPSDIRIVGVTVKGEEIDIPSKRCTFEGFDSSKETTLNMTVSYTIDDRVLTDTFQLEVINMRDYLIGFRIDQEPTKKIYSKGENEVDLSGGRFSARYHLRDNQNDSKWTPIHEKYVSAYLSTNDYFDGDEALVTVTYGKYSQTYTVTIGDEEYL